MLLREEECAETAVLHFQGDPWKLPTFAWTGARDLSSALPRQSVMSLDLQRADLDLWQRMGGGLRLKTQKIKGKKRSVAKTIVTMETQDTNLINY